MVSPVLKSFQAEVSQHSCQIHLKNETVHAGEIWRIDTLQCPYCAILNVTSFVLKVSYSRFTFIQGQKTLYFSHNMHAASALFSQSLKRFDEGFGLLSESLLCSDWSDGPVCCD